MYSTRLPDVLYAYLRVVWQQTQTITLRKAIYT